jgi:uncharacterized protein
MYSLPLFPLNTVLFPGIPLQLHIFEPRYRLMMRYCIDQQKPFGVVLIQHGIEALGPLAEPHRIGCTARITEVESLPDGRMNLTAMGDDRFRILSLNHDLPYLTGEVESLPLERPHSIEIMRGLRRLSPWMKYYLKLVHQADPDEELDLGDMRLPEDPLALLNLAAALLQVPAAEKQPLLEATYASEMLDLLERLYRRETVVLRGCLQSNDPAMERGAWLN